MGNLTHRHHLVLAALAGISPALQPDFGWDGDFGEDDDLDFGMEEDDDDDLDDLDDPFDDGELDDPPEEEAFEGDPELGVASWRKRGMRRRANRHSARGRALRRKAGGKRRRGRPAPKKRVVTVRTWGATLVSGTSTGDTGAVSLAIRLQHDFKAHDITFEGSTATAKINSITFGDHQVWNNTSGVPVSVFSANGFLRGLLKGQKLKAGLDITVTGTFAADSSTMSATLTGSKPKGYRQVRV